MSEIAGARALPAPPASREERPLSAAAAAAPAAQPPADGRIARIERLELAAGEAFADARGKLSIRYDEPTGRFVYRELDPQTGEVLREFPPEEVLERLARLKSFAGANLDRKA
jgi:hypothetical protein